MEKMLLLRAIIQEELLASPISIVPRPLKTDAVFQIDSG